MYLLYFSLFILSFYTLLIKVIALLSSILLFCSISYLCFNKKTIQNPIQMNNQEVVFTCHNHGYDNKLPTYEEATRKKAETTV